MPLSALPHRRTLALAAVLLAAGAVAVTAGPLNPPPGAPAPTGNTTGEIYSAIQGIAAGQAAGGACSEAIPGPAYSAGTFSMTPSMQSGGSAFSLPLYGLTFEVGQSAPSGGGGATRAQLTKLVILTDLGDYASQLFDWQSRGAHADTLDITLPRAGANSIKYRFQLVAVGSIRHVVVQRCDGSYANLQELTLGAGSLILTSPQSGQKSWSWVENAPVPGGP